MIKEQKALLMAVINKDAVTFKSLFEKVLNYKINLLVKEKREELAKTVLKGA